MISEGTSLISVKELKKNRLISKKYNIKYEFKFVIQLWKQGNYV